MIIHFNDTQLEVPVDDNSYRYRSIMGEHSLTLTFSLAEHADIPVGAWCEFQGLRYELMQPGSFKKNGSRHFAYTLVMESDQARLKKYKLLNTADRRLKFSLTAKPSEHLQLLIDNLNLRDSGWSAGACIEGTEKPISYNHVSCADALSQMADAFETEWEVDGKTIHLRKVEYDKQNPLALSYGRGNGFKPGVGRSNYDNSKAVEMLYVQGGERNIDPGRYGNRELLLPRNTTLRYDGAHFEGEEGFDADQARAYVTDPEGYSVRRADKPLLTHEEESLDCSHIYPAREGSVEQVSVADADKNYYDFTDPSIPADLDFSQCLIPGETMSVIFQSGILAGREFDARYKHEGRRFELVPQETDGVLMPNETFLPKKGDRYAVFHIALPGSYVEQASREMLREAVRHLRDNEEPRFSFTGPLDGIWAKRNWANVGGRLRLGGYVSFSDAQFQRQGVLIRITGIKDSVNDPHSPTLELSNVTVTGSLAGELKKIPQQEVVAEENRREALSFTKRRFRDAQQTAGMLEKAFANFSGSVNPVTVQTMQVLLGDESLQFRFVNDPANPAAVRHDITYDDARKQLKAQAGTIQHMTLGISSLGSAHKPEEYKFWNVPEFTSGVLDQPEKSYYLYAKVSKSSAEGSFELSEEARSMDGGTHYFLLAGVLNSEYEGSRSFVRLYGYTELLPGQMTVDRVVSSDGQCFLDFVASAFRIGDRQSSLSWNIDGNRQLLLRGTMVQSPAGEISALACWRGGWNAAATYYPGDEVSHDGSTYRCIRQSAAGTLPTDTAHWKQTTAKGNDGTNGKDGADGKTVHITYHDNPITSKPAKPTGDGTTGGWHTASSSNCVWMSQKVATHVSEGTWGEPIQIKGDGIESIQGNSKNLFWNSNFNFAIPFSTAMGTFSPTLLTEHEGNLPLYGDRMLQWFSPGMDGKEAYTTHHFANGYLKPNTTYTFSIWWKCAGGEDMITSTYWFVNKNGGGWNQYNSIPLPPKYGGWQQSKVTFTTNAEEKQRFSFRLGFACRIPAWIVVNCFSLVEGPIGYAWERNSDETSTMQYVYKGDFTPQMTCDHNPYKCTVVKKEATYYRYKWTDGLQPAAFNNFMWEPFGASFDSVATSVLLAENADIAGFHFKDQKMVSQSQTAGGSYHLTLDGVKGEITALKGNFGPFSANDDMVTVNGLNDNKTWFMRDLITSVDDAIKLGGSGVPSGTISVPSVSAQAETGLGNSVAENSASSAAFTVGKGVTMTFSFSGNFASDQGQGSVSLYLENQQTGSRQRLRSFASFQMNDRFDDPGQYTFSQEGTYKMVTTVRAESFPDSQGHPNPMAAISCGQISCTFSSSTRKNLIAPNGIAMVQATNQYAVMTGDIFQVRNGNAGLKIDSTGVYVMRNGNWSYQSL